MADKTWDDLQDFIDDELPRDAVVNPSVYVRRINIAIGIINSKSGGFDGYWNNDPDDDGTLALSGSACTFPADLLDARVIHWADTLLHYRTEAQMEALDPRWRTRSGTPSLFTLTARGLVLDSDPGDDTGGPLEIWGAGCIPELDLAADSSNPFAYLPTPHQMAPAFYVLGYLPLYGRSREDVIAIQADYRKQWEAFLSDVAWGVIVRKYPRMSS